MMNEEEDVEHLERDRGDSEEVLTNQRFSMKLLPPFLRKRKSVEKLIPWLYLKGISTGDFTEVRGITVIDGVVVTEIDGPEPVGRAFSAG